MMAHDRRYFLKSSVLTAASFLLGCSSGEKAETPDTPIGLTPTGELLGSQLKDPFVEGEFLSSLPFKDDGSFVCGERKFSGLDGRMGLDLSRLQTLTTANDDFYIRSFCPDEWPGAEGWKIRLHGLVKNAVELDFDQLQAQSRSMGPVLMECAGNGRPLKYGLISAANWDGIPVTEILEQISLSPSATGVLISGFDATKTRSKHSYPGASWVFTLNELKKSGAFLATRMNDQPLSKDHGAPVRLVVPGWFGCTCIKWLNEIRLVDDTEPATSQMREFAVRTHQADVHEMAREYLPATIDRTAVAIRVEKWRLEGKIVYRVVGLTWGNNGEGKQLLIRFSPHEEYQTVSLSSPLRDSTTWSAWSHRWEPTRAASYPIQLKVADDNVETRRLDMDWYERWVTIQDFS